MGKMPAPSSLNDLLGDGEQRGQEGWWCSRVPQRYRATIPGGEAGITETPATWPAGGWRVFVGFTCPFLLFAYGIKPVQRHFLEWLWHLLPLPVRRKDHGLHLMVLLAELQKNKWLHQFSNEQNPNGRAVRKGQRTKQSSVVPLNNSVASV